MARKGLFFSLYNELPFADALGSDYLIVVVCHLHEVHTIRKGTDIVLLIFLNVLE